MSVLTTKVLVLNRSYFPVHVTSARRALSLLYQGVAKAVDQQYRTFDFESWSALSASLNDDTVSLIDRVIRVPRVVLLVGYDRVPKRQVRFSRFNVFARDNNTCQYCGKRFSRNELNLDHVIPRDRGGPTTWENTVCSCIACNTRKANRTPSEAGMHLIRHPRRPDKAPAIRITFGLRNAPESWRDYVYWNVELDEDDG